MKRRKPSASEATASAGAQADKPPRATLVLKTFDPISGVTLKYRTTKAAEVSRLMGAAMSQLGRSMAALPEVVEEAMPDAGAEDTEEQAPAQKQQQQQTSAPPATGGGGGGKKKKKGKK